MNECVGKMDAFEKAEQLDRETGVVRSSEFEETKQDCVRGSQAHALTHARSSKNFTLARKPDWQTPRRAARAAPQRTNCRICSGLWKREKQSKRQQMPRPRSWRGGSKLQKKGEESTHACMWDALMYLQVALQLSAFSLKLTG